jgi:hypothetical protein
MAVRTPEEQEKFLNAGRFELGSDKQSPDRAFLKLVIEVLAFFLLP